MMAMLSLQRPSYLAGSEDAGTTRGEIAQKAMAAVLVWKKMDETAVSLS